MWQEACERQPHVLASTSSCGWTWAHRAEMNVLEDRSLVQLGLAGRGSPSPPSMSRWSSGVLSRYFKDPFFVLWQEVGPQGL